MAEDTKITESTETEEVSTETEVSTEKVETEQKPTILERIQSHQDKPVDETDKEPEKTEPIKTGKKTAQERIQGLISERKGLEEQLSKEKSVNTELTGRLTGLESRFNQIQEQLSKGDISSKEAEKKAEGAVSSLMKWIDTVEVSEELKPYREDIAKLIMQGSEAMIKPLREQIDGLIQERKERITQETEKGITEFQDSMIKSYREQTKSYPHLFEKPTKEGDLPELKTIFDKETERFVNAMSVPYTDEKGKTTEYNPLLVTSEGRELLFSHLSRFHDKVEKAKLEVEKQNRLKREKTEAPAETRISSQSGKKSVLEMIKDKQKEIGG